MDTAFTAEFADGEYRFWLPMPQVFEFERENGPLTKFEEDMRPGIGVDGDDKFVFMGGGSASSKAILEIIRLALIGGNSGEVNGEEDEVGPIRAKRLVAEYCYPARPLSEAAALAFRIASTAIFGIKLKAQKKTDDEPDTEPSPKVK